MTVTLEARPIVRFVNELLDKMDARRKRQERQAALIFGGGCLVLLVLGVVMVIVGSILDAVETANVKSTYGEDLASACRPVPAGSDSVDNLPDVPTPRGVLLLISDSQRRHAWHSSLPEQWRAENAEEVAIIGCVEELERELETCEYSRDSARADQAYTVRIRREQHEATIVLINPSTSRRIDSLTLSGSLPEPCPEDDGSMTSGEIQGSEVAWDDVAAWVETYIFGE